MASLPCHRGRHESNRSRSSQRVKDHDDNVTRVKRGHEWGDKRFLVKGPTTLRFPCDGAKVWGSQRARSSSGGCKGSKERWK